MLVSPALLKPSSTVFTETCSLLFSTIPNSSRLENLFPSPLQQLLLSTHFLCFQMAMGMQKYDQKLLSGFLESVGCLLRKCLFSVLALGPLPCHIAFILDGNRRYAKAHNIKEGSGHRAGFVALMSTLRYCYELGVKYVTVYAFSIDNFKRKPEEVQSIMDLLQEKIEELLGQESIVSEYGIKLNFWGNLDLLSDSVRSSVEKAMKATSNNSGLVLSVCIAYTSTNEIAHAVEEVCLEKCKNNTTNQVISVTDLEQKLFSADCPDPDILVRTSGETRLSNFLFWQTTFAHLQNPTPLWPEYSLKHLVWAILEYQRVQPYFSSARTTKAW